MCSLPFPYLSISNLICCVRNIFAITTTRKGVHHSCSWVPCVWLFGLSQLVSCLAGGKLCWVFFLLPSCLNLSSSNCGVWGVLCHQELGGQYFPVKYARSHPLSIPFMLSVPVDAVCMCQCCCCVGDDNLMEVHLNVLRMRLRISNSFGPYLGGLPFTYTHTHTQNTAKLNHAHKVALWLDIPIVTGVWKHLSCSAGLWSLQSLSTPLLLLENAWGLTPVILLCDSSQAKNWALKDWSTWWLTGSGVP